MRMKISPGKLVLGLVAGLIAFGTLGFHVIERWPWFQSLYATLMTISTIGAEPENQLSQQGRLFNVVLIFVGVGVVGFAIGTFTRKVIESELGSVLGRRRMEKEISRLTNHYIICGLGRVGRRVAAEMAARHIPLVIIEKDPARAQWAVERGLPVIVGDATKEEMLSKARIHLARGLASAVTSDAQNVYITLTARGIAPNLPIIARASEEDAEPKLLRAGATTVVSPYLFAGQRIARMLIRPSVQRFIDLAFNSSPANGNLDLNIEEMKVPEHSKLCGMAVKEVHFRERFGVILLALRGLDGQLYFNPRGDTTISAGEFLIMMGDTEKLKALESVAGVHA